MKVSYHRGKKITTKKSKKNVREPIPGLACIPGSRRKGI
jgi:hypothetical protein